MSTTTLILLYLGAALVGSRLPFIRVFLAHVHNLVSLVISVCLEGGRNKILLLRDGSGQTSGKLASPFKKALISYAGYTSASMAALGLFYIVARGSYHLVIYLYMGTFCCGIVGRAGLLPFTNGHAFPIPPSNGLAGVGQLRNHSCSY
ncbi:hypothetical protein [Neobacillus dielmonensis]|uniref:hypothetical protein n=1 Tax=Neobacillus dielmonensis TaxID=1347369 RepID=UPI0005A791A0|nr:hypothetical protein [Neobacillus dielmonensis]